MYDIDKGIIEAFARGLEEYRLNLEGSVEEYLADKSKPLEDRKEVYDKYYTGLLPFEYV